MLDGLRVRFDKGTNPDVGAFHEAFADLVAMLLRFSYKQVVRSNIRATKGDLAKDSDLLHMVLEVARGGEPGIFAQDRSQARRRNMMPRKTSMNSARFSSSAIIEAFLKIYARKAEPYIRIATGGRDCVARMIRCRAS